jgi:hypothetical protein
MPLEEYDSHFANAFTHIEKAKMAVRAMHPVCHQAGNRSRPGGRFLG